MWKYFCYAVGFLLGAGMLIGGAFVLHNMPDLFAHKIKSNLPIVRGSDAYERYTVSKVPLLARMFVFNVTNPEDVAERGAKPILQQVGPFSFSEKRKKEVVGFSADNKTLDYRLIRTYFFNESASASLDSILTLPNAPAFSAMFNAKERKRDDPDSFIDALSIAQEYLSNETMYITRPARVWLFDGIKLNFLDGFNKDGVTFDDQPPDNTFGFYYKKNNTWDKISDGTMTISTGVDGNFQNIGKVVRWNNKENLDFWKPGSRCNHIVGTDGQFFHPFIDKKEKLDIFAPDLCRPLTIEYNQTVFLRSIELYRYQIASSFFAPIDSSNETSCFCVKKDLKTKQKFCKLRGVVDASSCRKKPIVLSTPHFFNGDQSLAEQVVGIEPSAAEHDTFIDIEPMTGAVLRVRRRLQLNVEMHPTEGFEMSKNIKKGGIIHPFVWLDQAVTIPDELAQKLENKLTKTVRMVRILCYAALITGPLILIATLIYICSDIHSEDKKIRGSKGSSNKQSSEYQKVNVVMRSINPTNVTGGDSKA